MIDHKSLIVKRVSDNKTVVQVRASNIHQIVQIVSEFEPGMSVEGWTDDSKHIVFKVGTLFPLPYTVSESGLESISGLFILTVAED